MMGSDTFLTEELERLRESYVTATPRQRLSVVRQRLDNPRANPNVLVTHVAAVEALARSLVMNSYAKSKEELKSIYPKFRYRKAQTLVADYLELKGRSDPAAFFGEGTWANFKHAVNYRNLLVHESTYLANYKFDPLVIACEEVLKKMAKLARLNWVST